MRTLIITILLAGSMFNTTAQNTELIGAWDICQFTRIVNDEVYITSEVELLQNDSVWTLDLWEDLTVIQSSNMRTGIMEAQNGIWETEGEDLRLHLEFEGQEISLTYNYLLEDDVLLLKRQNPTGTLKLEISFMKRDRI